MKNKITLNHKAKPSGIYLVGLNHQTAPVAVREKVAINASQLDDALLLLRKFVPNGIILSTCNRMEVFAADGRPDEEAILDFIKAFSGVTMADLLPYVYLHEEQTAFSHLFRIASGLDSLIIGEYEVLGQIRQSIAAAENASMVTPELKYVFQCALRAGRQVREATGISRSALSVSSVAVDMAEKAIGTLEGRNMLVIGAGEAGRMVAKVARERGVPRIVIASRTLESASALVEMVGGIPADLEHIEDELLHTDIIVTCAGAPTRILETANIEDIMRKRKHSPLAIIDIAVPRNVEPGVGKLKNVFLYNIDDLTKASEANRRLRESEIEKAEHIVEAEVARCIAGWKSYGVKPVISALMQKAEEIRTRQLKRTLKKMRPLTDEEQYNLDAMTRSIVNRILQEPVENLKNNHTDSDYPGIVSELFGLQPDEETEV